MRRRDALVIGAAVAVALAVPPVLRRMPSEFDFEPLPGFDGFRRLGSGPTSGSVSPFAGLGGKLPEVVDAPMLQPPCLALFGPEDSTEGRLPIAVFSDFNCPYCKELEERLLRLEADGAAIRLVWHEMPLLGESSRRAARAVLAARFLGVERVGRAYLWQQRLPPGETGLLRMATALEIDAASLMREVKSTRVDTALARSLDLGGRLGIPGTPGTVVGRTLVIGAIKDADLRKLIRIETGTLGTLCA
jgi:hypothetical protein